MPRESIVPWGITLLALLLVPASAWAQDGQEAEDYSVRLISVKGSGQRAEGEDAQVPEELRSWASILRRLPLLRFEFLGRAEGRWRSGQAKDLSLPADHSAEAVVSPAGKGRLKVRLEITRPGKEPGGERERVLLSEVSLKDGQHYVINCEEALGAGQHLLILVTASERELD